MNPNALKQWLDFYDQQRIGPRSAHPFGYGAFGGGGGVDDDTGARLAFAQQMAGQQDQPQQQAMPDYFANVPSNTQPPMNPQAGYNRLAMLMGRRY